MTTAWKRRIGLILFLAVLIGFLIGASAALTPYENTPGMKWRAYKNEPKNSLDALFVGSSYAFCDIIPAKIYQDSGVTSYVIGAPSMPPRLMEYYLKEAYRTQSPQVVFIELTGVNYPAHTEYVEMNIGFMPFSGNRLAATFSCAAPEKRAGLLFPLYLYHDTWNTVTGAEIRDRLFNREPDIAAGYCYRDAAGDIPTDTAGATLTSEEAIYRDNLVALARMIAFANGRGAKVVCYLKADLVTLTEESLKKLRTDVTALGGDATFFYGNDFFTEMELDREQDFFDPSHMNYRGAKKFSAFLARRMTEQELVRPSGREDKALWQARVDRLALWDAE